MTSGDPITNQVKDWCLAIIDYLLESGLASLEEIYETLNIQDPRALQEDLDEFEVVVKDLFESARNLFDEHTLSICPKRMNNELVISKRITKRF